MTQSLVETDWIAEHSASSEVQVIEINRDGLDAYRAGHIPGAIGWNWKAMLWDDRERQFPAPEVFAKRLGDAGIGNHTTVALCGVPIQFGTYAWWVFRYLGHKDVRLLDGGMTRWGLEDRPLTTATPKITPTRYQPNAVNNQMRAGRDDVLAALNMPDTTLIDHRSFEEYSAARVSPPGMADVGAERYGRIPGARHLPYTAMLNEDDTFKSPSQLSDLVKPMLTDESAQAISYCRLSHRATLAYFAMTEILGYRNLRVYDGSWTEWGSMVGVPIET